MKLSEQDKQDFDAIEKWMVVSGLHGISIKELWDSDDDEAHTALEKLEEIESYAALIAENTTAVKVALQAHNAGITTDKLWTYQNWQNELYDAEQEKIKLAEEAANPMLFALNNAHNLKLTQGINPRQTYWEFDADLGEGWKHYKCRHVKQSWWNQRVWREWTDNQGKKQVDKFQFGSTSNTFKMDKRWPVRWHEQYNGSFRGDQVPWAYTQMLLDNYQRSIKPKRKARSAKV